MPITGTPVSGDPADLWVSVSEATEYFETRHGVGTLWSGLSDDAAKTALLTTAQQPLENDPQYTIPETVTQAMKDAVCEQAFFMLLDPDMELRSALQTQGVTEANLVMERYRESAGGEIPVAPRARQLLKSIDAGDNNEFRLVR